MKILIILMVMICLIGTITAVQAAWPVEELSLNPAGGAFDVNPDAEGGLWVSDFDAGEVWYLGPQSGEYTIYKTGGFPSDARRSGDYFWWVDGVSNFVGRAAVADGSYLLWQVDNAQTFCCATAIDSMGRLWATEWTWTSIDSTIESGIPHLIQVSVNFGETSSTICTFTLPDGGGAEYLAYDDPYLWLGDDVNNRIIRFNAMNYHYTHWRIPSGSQIFDLDVDEEGDVWFADLSALVEFDPDTSYLTSYGVPLSGGPQMVAVEGYRVWYTGYNSIKPAIGAMYPIFAEHDNPLDLSASMGEGTLSPECQYSVYPLESKELQMPNDSSNWNTSNYPELQNAEGWKILEMPNGADPWGIAQHEGMIYVVDNGRQKLVKLPTPDLPSFVYLPLILR